MDRRNFMSASLASLIGALAPFRSDTDPIADAIINEEAPQRYVPLKRVFSSYSCEQGMILPYSEDRGGILFSGLGFSVEMLGGNHMTAKVEGRFHHLMAPKSVMDAFVREHGDVVNAHKRRIIMALVEHKMVDANEAVILNVTKPILNSVGLSVSADDMLIAQDVHFIAYGEPFGGKLKHADKWISEWKEHNKIIQRFQIEVDEKCYQTDAWTNQMYQCVKHNMSVFRRS